MENFNIDEFFVTQWKTTVRTCEDSLEPDDVKQLGQLRTWDHVYKDISHPAEDDEHLPNRNDIALIIPSLRHIHVLTSFFETRLCSTVDTAFIWGCIGLVLRLTANDGDALTRVPRMFKSIGYKAEAFNGYNNTSHADSDHMKEPCFDVHIQLAIFLTNTIKILRRDTKGVRHAKDSDDDDPWPLLEREYAVVNQELIECLSRVEKLAVIRSSNEGGQQLSLPERSISQVQKPRHMMFPPTRTSQFYDRVDIFAKLDESFGVASAAPTFRSVALFGLGGIGKSSIAGNYVEKKAEADEYEAIFWVHAENSTSLRQSFADIATRLKLPGAQLHGSDENLVLVQNWFHTSEYKWLIVYDNVESSKLLMPYWPETSHGRALITTRNPSVVFELATTGLEVTSWDTKTGSEFLLFLLKKNIGNDLALEGQSAFELSKALSGHAMGLSHMAGLIHRRSWSIAEFLSMYQKNPKRAHTSDLQAIWDLSFKSLDKDSSTLLGICSFLMPDSIAQSLFETEGNDAISEDLDFCSDDFGFSGALEPLLTLALLKRDRDTRILAVHRLVQRQFRYFLPLEERQKAFDLAVELLYDAFPQHTDVKGQLYDQWAACHACLQHVVYLSGLFKDERKTSKTFVASAKFCEVLVMCQRYVYETNDLRLLQELCDVNLMAVEALEDSSQAIDFKASILSLQASRLESVGQPQEAIVLHKQGYELRLSEQPPRTGLLAGFESNLGFTYNTANDHQTALIWFQKSRDRWSAEAVKESQELRWPTHMKANMARCYFYLGELEVCRQLINESIKEFRESKPLDWAMMAFAFFVLGLSDRREGKLEEAEKDFIEAQNMWVKGDQTRLHPFYAACMFKTGAVCLDQGTVEAAIKHLRDSLEITQKNKDLMPVEHARNLFKLSEALTQDVGDDTEVEAETLRDDAEVYLKRRDPQAKLFGHEAEYDRLIPIFWR